MASAAAQCNTQMPAAARPAQPPAAQQGAQHDQRQQDRLRASVVISLEDAKQLVDEGERLPVERQMLDRLRSFVEAGIAWQAAAAAVTSSNKVRS